MTRIVHIADYGAAVPGSFIAGLNAVFALVRQRGWDPELVLPERARQHAWPRAVARDGVVVNFVDTGRRSAARDLSRRPRRGVAQIVHTHFTSFDVAAATGGRAGATHVVWHIHSRPGRHWPNLQDAIKFGMLARLTSRVLCVGRQISDDIVRRGAPEGRVHVVGNGIDLRHFCARQPGERTAAREALGLPARGLVLLHLGHDPYLKGTDRVLSLRRELPDSTILVVAAPAAQRLTDRCVRYVEPVTDPRPLYMAADALIAPSRAEGGNPPFALSESLACGTPVIASAIPGHQALAGLCPAVRLSDASPQSLAADVRRLPPTSDASFDEARMWLTSNFSVERYADEIMRHYDEILERT